jgi:hypothetical protein
MESHWKTALTAIGLALCPATAFSASAHQSGAQSPEKLAAIHATGAMIYAYDRAAWVATDAMLAEVPRDRLSAVRGWVVTPEGDDLVVTFQSETGDAAKRFFQAWVRDGKVVKSQSFANPQSLNEAEAVLARARDAAFGHAEKRKLKSCTPARFNSVILPPEAPGLPVRVYLLSAQVEAGNWPLGGHYLVQVDDSGKVGRSRGFMNTCLPLAKPKTAPATAAFFVTHLLDQTPTEIHAFTAIASAIPIVVATRDKKLWSVTRNGIVFEKTLTD